MRLAARLASLTPNIGRPSRKTALPLAILCALCIVTAGAAVKEHVPYWIAGDPGVHADQVPENALAYLQLDLVKASQLPVPPRTAEKIRDLFGISGQTDPEEWAGGYASATILPNGEYVVIVDVRDRPVAQNRLLKFMRQPTAQVRELWADQLAIASSHEVLDEILQRKDNPRLATLSQTELYRHALLNRPGKRRPAAFYFIRPQAIPEPWRDNAGLLSGCNTAAYLVGAIQEDEHGNLAAEAWCPRLLDGEPDQPTAQPIREIESARQPDIVLHAAFHPTAENIIDQAVKISAPGLSNPIAGAAKLVNGIPPLNEAPIPFSDPADAATANQAQGTMLDSVQTFLDGSIVATYSGGSNGDGQYLEVNLGHGNETAARASVEQILGSLTSSEATGVQNDAQGYDWVINAGEEPAGFSMGIATTDTEILIHSPARSATEHAQLHPIPYVPSRGYHTLLYLAPHQRERPLAGWWERDYWIHYTNTRRQASIDHKVTIGAAPVD